MSPRARAVRGFTLIEVLVALIIVALGMGALMSALTSSADSVQRLREKGHRITLLDDRQFWRLVGKPS